MTKTAFARWLDKMGYTQEAGRAALGLSLSHVKQLCAGVHRTRGNTIKPDLRTRLAMRAVEKKLKPWPED